MMRSSLPLHHSKPPFGQFTAKLREGNWSWDRQKGMPLWELGTFSKFRPSSSFWDKYLPLEDRKFETAAPLQGHCRISQSRWACWSERSIKYEGSIFLGLVKFQCQYQQQQSHFPRFLAKGLNWLSNTFPQRKHLWEHWVPRGSFSSFRGSITYPILSDFCKKGSDEQHTLNCPLLRETSKSGTSSENPPPKS